MRILMHLWQWILFVLTGKGEIADEMVDAGILDMSGQGRDKYGR